VCVCVFKKFNYRGYHLIFHSILLLFYRYEHYSKETGLKTYLTNSTSPLIMKLKLFIYLRNLCSGLMTKNLMYLA